MLNLRDQHFGEIAIRVTGILQLADPSDVLYKILQISISVLRLQMIYMTDTVGKKRAVTPEITTFYDAGCCMDGESRSWRFYSRSGLMMTTHPVSLSTP